MSKKADLLNNENRNILEDPWVDTVSGRQFSLFHPTPDDIYISDIAHSLALQCRYRGITTEFYSVAEHCIRISRIAHKKHGKQMGLWGLLHDASEAYLGDIIRPLKYNMGGIYKRLEVKYMIVITQKFNLPLREPNYIKLLDNILLITERRDLIKNQTSDWGFKNLKPLKERIIPMEWRIAKQYFLDTFEDLTEEATA